MNSKILETRRQISKTRISDLSKRIDVDPGPNVCVYATGSVGRGESSDHSDLDLFIVGGNDEQGNRLLPRLDEICLKASLIKATRDQNLPEFSGDGEYLVHYTVGELVKTLGQPSDDSSNTFTARLLLLLESTPLIGEQFYGNAIGQVIRAYWRDFDDHKNDFAPTFLANDILRLWRTFCVNYEARTKSEPDHKKIKRRLKNYKLKHSRLLTCFSALAYLLSVFSKNRTVTPGDAQEMTRMTPSQRLEWLLTQGYSEPVRRLLDCYFSFLTFTAQSESSLVAVFSDPAEAKKLLAEANQFGDSMFHVLEAIGRPSGASERNRFFRMLTV